MPYCTDADLVDQLPEEKLREYAADNDDELADEALIASRIGRAITTAAEDTDLLLQGRYPVPLEPCPKGIRNINVSIAIYHLASRKGFRKDTSDQVIVDRYEAAIRVLTKIGEGKLDLPMGDEPTQPEVAVTVRTRERTFSDELLEKF